LTSILSGPMQCPICFAIARNTNYSSSVASRWPW